MIFRGRARLSRLAGIAVAAIALAAVAASAHFAPVQSKPVKEIKLSVPGPGSGESLLLELVNKLGIDRDEGILLRLQFVDGGGVALDELMSANVSFAVLGLPAAMNSAIQDPRIVALAAIHDLPLYTLMVRSDLRGKVKRVEDLKGRTIGVHSSTLATRATSRQLTELVLQNHGVSLDDVRLVADGQSWATISAGIVSGEVDASMCDEPLGEQLAQSKLAFPMFSTGNPEDARSVAGGGFLRGVLISRRDYVAADPATAERMVRIIQRGSWGTER